MGFKKKLESKCSKFYLGSNKKNYIYKKKIASSGGSFEPPELYMAPPMISCTIISIGKNFPF